MADVLRALGRALFSQLHPRMLWLAIWPFLLAVALWGGLGWWFRQEALAGLQDVIGSLTLVGWIDAALAAIGIGGFRVFLVPLVYLGLLIPAIVVTALLIIAVVALPGVIAHVATRSYPDVLPDRSRGAAAGWALSLFNTFWVTLVFVVGWIATMPLWLIAPLVVVLPLLWCAWLNARILRVDCLLEHASAAERALLIARHRRGFFMLGLCVSLLNFVPPMFFLAPVYSGLAFTHYSLQALRRLRAEVARDAAGSGGGSASGGAGVPVATAPERDMGAVEIVGPDAGAAAPPRLPDSGPPAAGATPPTLRSSS